MDVNRCTVKRSFQVHQGLISYIGIAHQNSEQAMLVTAGDNRFIRLWDVVDVSLRDEQPIASSLPVLSVYVDQRERPQANLIWAPTGRDQGKLFFYNITDHKHVKLPSRHKHSIATFTVVQSEMKVQMLSSDYDGISLWSIDSILENMSYAAVSLIKMWKGRSREILSSAGQWMTELPVFATGGNDKDVHIWTEVDQGYVDQLLRGHTDSIMVIVFEGYFLITESEDLAICIWDTVNMVQLSIITRLDMSAIRAVVYQPVDPKFAIAVVWSWFTIMLRERSSGRSNTPLTVSAFISTRSEKHSTPA
jgi:WD40 repeat protein